MTPQQVLLVRRLRAALRLEAWVGREGGFHEADHQVLGVAVDAGSLERTGVESRQEPRSGVPAGNAVACGRAQQGVGGAALGAATQAREQALSLPEHQPVLHGPKEIGGVRSHGLRALELMSDIGHLNGSR